MLANFLLETTETRIQWNKIFRALQKKKNTLAQNSISRNISIKTENDRYIPPS